MKKSRLLGALCAYFTYVSFSVDAAFFTADNAVAFAGGDLGGFYDVGNIIDGSGLNVHDETGELPGNIDSNFGTAFYSGHGNTTGTINFTFNAQVDIETFYLWQAVHAGFPAYSGLSKLLS